LICAGILSIEPFQFDEVKYRESLGPAVRLQNHSGRLRLGCFASVLLAAGHAGAVQEIPVDVCVYGGTSVG